MAVIDIYNLKREKVGEAELCDEVFRAKVKPHLLHFYVKTQLADKRGGNACTKGRSDVRGGAAKPWRQKGTGRARSGTSSSPVWVGGGAAFGPKPRSHRLGINKKVRKLALRSVLSMKYSDNNLLVLENIDLSSHKTREFADTLRQLHADRPLIVYSGENKNLDLSSRNLPGVKTLRSEGINVFDMLKYETVIMTRESVENIEKVLKK